MDLQVEGDVGKQSRWKTVLRWARPSYDETTLFLMTATCIVLIATHAELRTLIASLFRPAGNDWRGVVIYAIFGIHVIGGALMSLSHAFMDQVKDPNEKWLMAIFALFVNGVAGVFAGTEMLATSTGPILVFPIANIVVGSLLIYQVGLSPEDCVSDDDATTWDIAVATLSLILVYGYLALRFDLSWAVEFSVCIAYASLFHRFTRMGVDALWRLLPPRFSCRDHLRTGHFARVSASSALPAAKLSSTPSARSSS